MKRKKRDCKLASPLPVAAHHTIAGSSKAERAEASSLVEAPERRPPLASSPWSPPAASPPLTTRRSALPRGHAFGRCPLGQIQRVACSARWPATATTSRAVGA
ncbi:hypothetical protein DAI22_02g103800 [Oryza sativa Japonica Group]|nr:hypothetical protein DAI22_02g103800 [Oryza sativa Japonica Group]